MVSRSDAERWKGRKGDRQTHSQRVPIHGFQLLLRCLEPTFGTKCVSVRAIDVLIVRNDWSSDAHTGAFADKVATKFHATGRDATFQRQGHCWVKTQGFFDYRLSE
jgi:hypothetical protein